MLLHTNESRSCYWNEDHKLIVCEDAILQYFDLNEIPDEIELILHKDNPDENFIELKDLKESRPGSTYAGVRFPEHTEGDFVSDKFTTEYIYNALFKAMQVFMQVTNCETVYVELIIR